MQIKSMLNYIITKSFIPKGNLRIKCSTAFCIKPAAYIADQMQKHKSAVIWRFLQFNCLALSWSKSLTLCRHDENSALCLLDKFSYFSLQHNLLLFFIVCLFVGLQLFMNLFFNGGRFYLVFDLSTCTCYSSVNFLLQTYVTFNS